MKLFRELVWLTQLGLSILSPLLLCVLLAVWLRNRFGVGGWVVVLGILLGLGGAVSAGVAFARSLRSLDDPKHKPPDSFNDHD